MEGLLNLSGEPVPRSRKTHILKLLGWLACARRSLRWFEIQAVMSVDTDDCIFDGQRRFVEDSIDLCGSLVETSSDGSVTLVHSTTREHVDQLCSSARLLMLRQIPNQEQLCAAT